MDTAPNNHYEIVLDEAPSGQNKLRLTKAIMAVTGQILELAKELVESAPVVITTVESEKEAHDILTSLEKQGGEITVRKPFQAVASSINEEDIDEMETAFSNDVTDVLDRFNSVLTEFWEQTTSPEEIGIPNLPTLHKFHRKSAFRQQKQSPQNKRDSLNPLYRHLLNRKELEDKLGHSLRPVPPEVKLPTEIAELKSVPRKTNSIAPASNQHSSPKELSATPVSPAKVPPDTGQVFWVRRGTGDVKGPINEVNLRTQIYENRVRPTDSFSTTSPNGPWQEIKTKFDTPHPGK